MSGSVRRHRRRNSAAAVILLLIGLVFVAIPYLWIVWSHQPKDIAGWQPVARNGGSVLYRRTLGQPAEIGP